MQIIEIGKLLIYEQPSKYIVKSTEYDDYYAIPVLTAGKTFILGYTDETDNVFDKLPVIIFDDFTTATKYVDFKFKVKSSAMKILHINQELVLPKYIFYRLQTINIDHSTHKRYWIQQYSKIKITIPTIPEQEQIVKQIEESLSQLDSAVATLNKTKQQLEIYRQAVLKEAFQGKLSSHRPVSCSLSFLSSQESNNYPPIANEWKYIKLSCLGELARGKSKHRPRNDRKLFENGKYPFVQTGDVKKADKYITDYENMYGDFGLQQSKLWKKGTLCITIAANIAETAFLGMDACFPDSVVGFLPSEYVLPEYIRYFIESQKVRLWAFAPATAQKNINLKTLENLVIPYCSIEEQAELIKIVDEKMSVCDRIKQVINQSLQQAEALRQSILKQAFEGN